MDRMPGRLVKPGEYTVRLTAGRQVLSTTVKVQEDPRIHSSAEEFTQQDDMLASLERDVADINKSTAQINRIRSQLATTLKKTTNPEIAAAARALDAQLNAIENAITGTVLGAGQRFVVEPPRLVDVYKSLHSSVNQVQPEVTDGDRVVFSEISREWMAYKAQIGPD